MTAVDFTEPRFTSPILTVRDVSELVGMPLDTVQAWAGQRRDRPAEFKTVRNLKRGWPIVPLVGLAEASSLRALRAALPPSEVREAAAFIRQHLDGQYPLANRRLVTDGATAYVQEAGGSVRRIRDSQEAIVEAFEEHLRPLIFLEDEYPVAYRVERLHEVEIDPRFNAGRMHFARNKVPVFVVADLLRAGELPAAVQHDFGLTRQEIRSVQRELDWLEKVA